MSTMALEELSFDEVVELVEKIDYWERKPTEKETNYEGGIPEEGIEVKLHYDYTPPGSRDWDCFSGSDYYSVYVYCDGEIIGNYSDHGQGQIQRLYDSVAEPLESKKRESEKLKREAKRKREEQRKSNMIRKIRKKLKKK